MEKVSEYISKHSEPERPVGEKPLSLLQPLAEEVEFQEKGGSFRVEKAGVVLAHAVPKNLPAGLIALTDTNGNIVGYWLVFQNFKSIMSYNSSVDYAMAVYQLSALY